MDFDFYMPTRVISGENCLLNHGSELRVLGKRCLIVTGNSAAMASGALPELMEVLGKLGIEATVYPGVLPNPLVSQCQAIAATVEICRAQFLIGIGGGSVMDATKAAAWLSANSYSEPEKLFDGSFRQPPLPTVMIGTTAGTGSEVDSIGVLTRDTDHRKKSFSNPALFPRFTFADPRYTATMSRAQTVSTGLDALCHVAEGWFKADCTDVYTAFGEKALSHLSHGLTALADSEEAPSMELRTEMLYGSLWAGVVLSRCGCCFCHPLGYVLTEDFHVPHGMACAVFLRAFLRHCKKNAPERYDQLVRCCGGQDVLDNIFAKLIRTESPVVMTPEQVETYAKRWDGLKNFDATPGGYSARQAANLFTDLFVKNDG